MKTTNLLEFLRSHMSMTDVYQPVVVKELLLHKGTCTKAELATALAGHDLAVQEYYERIVMRWPKITLTQHGIIDYERKGSIFRLLPYPTRAEDRDEAMAICDEKIITWLERKRSRERAPEAGASVRYEILKSAKGKCQLCGISSQVRPIDIDHIVPRSKANKDAKVRLNGKLIDVNDPENLQALCFSCNRAKRDKDETDFRRRDKLVRDHIPDLIRAEGRVPVIRNLKGKALTIALYEKLIEEHAELIAANDEQHKHEELADLIEVIFALGDQYGVSNYKLLQIAKKKNKEYGGFQKGYFYQGDEQDKGQNTKAARNKSNECK